MLNKMKTRKNVHMHRFNKIKIHKNIFSRKLTKDATNTHFEKKNDDLTIFALKNHYYA